MFTLFLFICLFHFNFGNETGFNTLYEGELPNDDNDTERVKTVKIAQNKTNSDDYRIYIIYKSEGNISNSFNLTSKDFFDIIKCVIHNQDECEWRYASDKRRVYIRYYDRAAFSLCLFKQYRRNDLDQQKLRSMCLDLKEYKRFINIVSFILNTDLNAGEIVNFNWYYNSIKGYIHFIKNPVEEPKIHVGNWLAPHHKESIKKPKILVGDWLLP